MSTSMRLVFDRLPAYVALAQPRLLVNGWPTSRRMSPGPQQCKLGCQAVGGEARPALPHLTKVGRGDPGSWA